ncbi:helix-turn-helix domain-containing protein [Janthinobacterium sp. B9-8]|uniref:helix-turn-helix domain-containing protein n=1 Tax=Janthinobacterium sp. B9-8 TaxID=1236179 RepID=UPI0012E35613|nr:helix-turn-helix domain-containing protein [Janthinobacterium sp. B9-8]
MITADDIMTTDIAAHFLKLTPKALRRKAKAGQVPATIITGKWLFNKIDLIDWLRQNSTKQRTPILYLEQKPCLSKSVATSGGLDSHMMAKKYSDLLGLKTKPLHKNGTIN